MYSEKKNIQQLVDLLRQHGVSHVVLCPGSRNTPLIHTFVQHPLFVCHSATDERSAAFMALGMAQELGVPVVACCTSGTALLNMHPAVCEAFYQQLPLIVISADRPQAWIGQMDGQTLPQPGVFGTLVKKSVHLPEIHSSEDAWHVNRMINEALLACTYEVCGPVHINVALSEPLFQYTVSEIPAERCIHSITTQAQLSELFRTYAQSSRCLWVVGQLLPAQSERIQPLLKQVHGVVLCEHLSNLSLSEEDASLKQFDAALSTLDVSEQAAYSPEILITFGGHIVSKRLKQMLRRNPPRQHWHISPSGSVADLFCALTHVLSFTPETVLQAFCSCQQATAFDAGHKLESSYHHRWLSLCHLPHVSVSDYSSLQVVQQFLQALPQNTSLHLANSSAVRLASLFPIPSSVRVYCNRGTSGIEGSLSTAMGVAALSSQLQFVLIGDLSFFYDMNALWSAPLRNNLRILLLNNSGGAIFRTLPGMDIQSESMHYIEATHQQTACGWAKDCGLLYYGVRDTSAWTVALRHLCDETAEGPVLVEVFTEIKQDAAQQQAYFNALK